MIFPARAPLLRSAGLNVVGAVREPPLRNRSEKKMCKSFLTRPEIEYDACGVLDPIDEVVDNEVFIRRVSS